MAPKELSAFERKRLENIATNKALLTDISATTKLVAPRPAPAEAKPRPKTRAAPRRTAPARAADADTPARGTRQSSRLAGLSATDDSLKRKLEERAGAERDKERAKRTRVAGDLALDEISIDGPKWDGGLGAIRGVAERGAQPGLRTWEDPDEGKDGIKDEDEEDDGSADGDVKALRKRLGRLELYAKWTPNEIKITPQRVYSLGFHPTEDKPIVFAGDKDGALGVFDASQDRDAEADDDDDDELAAAIPVISVFKAHARSLSALVFSPTDANAVFSASYDSSIRKVDLAKGVSTQVYAPADIRTEQAISAVEIPEMEPNMVYFSTLDGDLGRHDMRAPSHKARMWGLSEQKIGGFTLHPNHSHLVATASLDRTMRIWDLRKVVDDSPAQLGRHESRLSISHASWSAAGHVATTSYDDTIKIHSFGDGPASWDPGHVLTEAEMAPANVIKHNNQTGRWVTILKPHWQRSPRDGVQRFVVGNMNRFVDVFVGDGTQVAQLDGAGISAVPAVAHFHPTMEWVAGATGSGKLCLWT